MANGSRHQSTTTGCRVKKSISEWFPEPEGASRPPKRAARYPSGTIWPHGEWSYGYASEKPDGGEHQSMDWAINDAAFEQYHQEGLAAWLPFDLSGAANSHKRPRRGLKGMSGYGQQMIKAAGHLIQAKWPHHRKTLGTITLPEMTQQARAEVVAVWPELTRQLLQWLSRQLERQSLPPVILSVSEVQPKRLQETGQGCLHWHLLWLNQPGKEGNWAVDPCDVRAWLECLLIRKVPSYTGGFINVDTRRVEGVVAAYMAKYMSKGKQMIEEAVKDWGEDNCPRTWWNMTKACRDMVKAATVRGRIAGTVLVECFEHAMRIGVDDVYAFLRPVEVEIDNSRIIIGWRGRFLPEVNRALTRVLESFDIEGFEPVGI